MAKPKLIILTGLAVLGVGLTVGGVAAASYAITDNAQKQNILVGLKAAPTYVLNAGGQDYTLSLENNHYVYSSQLHLETGTITVKEGTNVLASYAVPVEGHYSGFSFDGESTLSVTQVDKAVYLKQLNSNRLWDAYYCHSWGDNSADPNYPGQAMELDSDKGVYKAFIAADHDSVIFSYHGVSGDAGSYSVDYTSHIKTADLTYDASAPLYQMSSNTSGEWSALGASKSFSSTYEYYLVGSFNGWTAGDPAYGMEMTVDADGSAGRYVCKVTFSSKVTYKIIKPNGGNSYDWYGVSAYSDWFTTSGGDCSINAGTYTFTIVDKIDAYGGVNVYIS